MNDINELQEACAGQARHGGSANFVRMFKPRFAELVKSGRKTQTIRPLPKRIPRRGDTISLRVWTGKPYRSKQRVLREAIIKTVASCEITETGVRVGPFDENPDDFARADGFRDFGDMKAWFGETHGLPFRGIMIAWHNDKVSHDHPTTQKETTRVIRKTTRTLAAVVL